jgi:hypothetical protein
LGKIQTEKQGGINIKFADLSTLTHLDLIKKEQKALNMIYLVKHEMKSWIMELRGRATI